ncbi:transmembrane protein 53-A-like isoform X2 [Uranotaenia lowii]|uniref:transmembrane protein 53-A-like isoform X2 n=1 Tax=Uranotaenia lowii TaxID=190385 RepID=UPI002479BF7B|nr:transmembrane protein 53-A-like isoform X2 [Uranotaenia lowii]
MVVSMIPSRGLAVQEITRSLQLISEDKRSIEKDPKTLQLKRSSDKPTVFIISWLAAKQKHLQKYAKIYIDQGFDVIVAQITPWQLLWPMKGSQLVAAEIVKFLKNNEFKNGLIIHGFSVAGYVWGECLVHIARDLNQYQVVLDRVKGQIWDSAADITEISVGVPTALFPRNPTLQNALRKYMLYHMKAFHEPATSHYIRSSQMFHTNLLRCPALFLVSKTDPVGTELANGRVRDSWESSGVKCTFKVWDRSPHVGHFQRHPEEYVECVFAHLRQLDLTGTKQALRAKL